MGHQEDLVLDSPIPKDSLELGSLIIDYFKPTRNLFFDDSLKENRAAGCRIDTNLEEFMTRTGSNQTKQSLLRRMLSTALANDFSNNHKLKSLECRIYELYNVSDLFREILSIPEARLWASNILKGRREFYLLTGYRTFRGKVLRKRSYSSNSINSIGVSVPELIRGPSIPVGWSKSRDQESQAQYQTAEEFILVVTYRKIKLKDFGQMRSAHLNLERGRDWLRPWTKYRSRSSGHISISFRDIPSSVDASQSNKLEKKDDEFGMGDLVSSNEGEHLAAEKDISGPLTSPTSSPSLAHEQNHIIARQEELHNEGSIRKAFDPITDFQSSTADNKSAKHESVIDPDGSEEPLEFREVGFSQDDDHVIGIVMEDDSWSEPKVSSRALIDSMPYGVEDLFTLFVRNSQLQPLYARAVQVATKDIFGVMLNYLLQMYAKDLRKVESTGLEKSAASFIRTRAPLVAALITRYLYKIHGKGMMWSMKSEEYSFTLEELIEEKDIRLYGFDEAKGDPDHFGDLAETDQPTPLMGNDFRTETMRSFLLNNSAFDQMKSRLKTFIAKQDSVRRVAWMGNWNENVRPVDVGSGLVLTLGLLPYFSFLLRSFPISCVFVATASLIAQSEVTSRGTNDGILARSPELFSIPSKISFSDVCQSPQTYLRVPAPLFVSSFVSYLKVVSRPAVRPGHRRIEWTCECGESLYDDFDNSDPGSVDALEHQLRLSRPSNEPSVGSSTRTLSAPLQAHVNPSGALSRNSRFSGRASTPNIPAHVPTSTHSRSPEEPPPKKYFELCINHGKWDQRLGEIDISVTHTDGELFRAIRNKYQEIRGFRAKKLYLLEPVNIHFIKFSLEERYRLNIHEKPNSWPSKKNKNWEYSTPKIPASTFLHHMRSKQPYVKAIWLPRMPKKLKLAMAEEESQLPVGWGIHVIEGLNKSLVSWLFWMVTSAVFVAGIAWSILKQKGVSVAPLSVGILGVFVSFITSEYYKQSDI